MLISKAAVIFYKKNIISASNYARATTQGLKFLKKFLLYEYEVEKFLTIIVWPWESIVYQYFQYINIIFKQLLIV